MSDKAPTLHDFNYASARIQALKKVWEPEMIETDKRRDKRYVRIDLERMRASGLINQDGVYVPRRIAHNNIKREMAPVVAYLSQSKDTAKFRALDNMPLPPEPLNSEFTKFSQHEDYMMPLLETADGAKTHGWDSTETVFDAEAPGRFRNQHIGHENLWFAWDAAKIQWCPILVVVYPVAGVQFEEYANEFEFDPAAVKEVRIKLDSEQDKDSSRIRLMKILFKDRDDGNIVYQGFYAESATNWLKAPEPLSLGKEQPETEYPIEVLRYSISEDEQITSSVGRVFEDEPDQEACTQLATSYVNRAIRSQYVMFAPTGPDDDSGQRQTKVPIGDGYMVKQPVNQFVIEPADMNVLTAMGTLTNQNANEAGQTNFAIQNRKDSRKTATENIMANQQGTMLSSVDAVLFSIYMKGIVTRNWLITQAQVMSKKLVSNIVNWEAYYGRKYSLLAAGDVDVIKRQEILQAMKQDWPVIQTTGARQAFLEDLLRYSPYAENADKYIQAIEAENWKDNLIKGMGNALKEMSLDPATGQLKPEAQPYAKQLAEIQQEYQQVMGQTQPGQGGQPDGQPEAQPGIQDNAPESGGEPA